jgi:AcrR family transcriptional regulator
MLDIQHNIITYYECNCHTLAYNRQEKINGILNATVKALSQKGYDQSTIADISKVANVARGALHYYFKGNEDLVTKALANSTARMVQSSLEGLRGESLEEIIDNVIDVHKNNISNNSDFAVSCMKCGVLVDEARK